MTDALPTTRKEAIAAGASHYFTGRPCKRGHVSERHRGGTCLACDREAQARRLQDPEHYAKHVEWSLQRYHRKKVSDPTFIPRVRANARAACRAPHRKSKQAETDRERYQNPIERSRMRENQRQRYRRLKDDPEFRAKERAASAKWRKLNPDKEAAATRLYQARKLGATPKWLTPEDRKAMRAMYAEARRRTKETGVDHVVDHVHPLRGRNFCGLHVPWNLQVLTAKANASKGNRLP